MIDVKLPRILVPGVVRNLKAALGDDDACCVPGCVPLWLRVGCCHRYVGKYRGNILKYV
jgi:hypothetical protein